MIPVVFLLRGPAWSWHIFNNPVERRIGILTQALKDSGMIAQAFVEMLEHVPTFRSMMQTDRDEMDVLLSQIVHQPFAGWNINRLAHAELTARAKEGIAAMVHDTDPTLGGF